MDVATTIAVTTSLQAAMQADTDRKQCILLESIYDPGKVNSTEVQEMYGDCMRLLHPTAEQQHAEAVVLIGFALILSLLLGYLAWSMR